MNETMSKHLKVILTKLCKYVNANFNEIDFKESDWFLKHSWGREQEEEFKQWMIDYLMNSKEARVEIMNKEIKNKKRIEGTVSFFLLSYGWKNNGDN